jgi:hypothetical protein
MEGSERDSTQDWLLPESARPPTVAELSQRIDEAVATARASEAAVVVVGEAALDAAEQARRAAGVAERAAATALDAQRRVMGGASVPDAGARAAPRPRRHVEADSLRSFIERADRITRRLQALERISLPGPVGTAA